MSWLYLPELVADCSQVDCSAGGPSAPLKSTSIASESCCSGSGTDTLNDSPSGTTCEPLTEPSGVEKWISLVAGFLASHSAEPGSNSAKTTNEICGRQPREYLAKYDRDSRCWRTSQVCLFQDTLEQFSEDWQKSGSMRSGVVYRRRAPVRRIYATASGSWPTPRSCTAMGATITQEAVEKAPSRFPNLETVVAMRQWPTPQAFDCKGTIGGEDWKHRNATREKGPKSSLTEAIGGSLNPPWVEWLMGWPIGWTALEPLATESFQRWLIAHGVNSQVERVERVE
jgi:hypothetical protein